MESVLFVLFLGLLSFSICGAEPASRHLEGYCAMYGICGARDDGKSLNCPSSVPSVMPGDLFSKKVQSLCPTITGNVCCDETQFDILRAQVQQAIPLLVGCPACLRNFLNLFCELSCSPNQSLFLNVTSMKKIGSNMTVDAVDFYLTKEFGEGLYESCKDVKLGSMNSRAMDFIGAGAKDYHGMLAFIGRRAAPKAPGSPVAITFKSTVPESNEIRPVNVKAYSCSDASLGCSCGDCPAAATCADLAPPRNPRSRSCRIKIGSLRAKCVDVAMTIVYLTLISFILGWSLFKRKRVGSAAAKLRKDSKEVNAISSEEVDTKMEHLSIIQIYISNFYRYYGTVVAKRPALVLISSVAFVLLLCAGLVRFKVESRPEKLWVGHGSKALEQKFFFDTHLAPFYRIEQLILATVPERSGAKPPSIVTDDNVKLLFDIQKKVDGIRANYSGSYVTLNDICLKPLEEECATQSVLQYAQMNPQNYDDNGGLDHLEYCFQHFTSADDCRSAFKAPLDPSTVLGGFSGNNYSEASAFIVTYPVTNEVSKIGNETGKAVAWEKAFIQLAKKELLSMVQSRNLTLSYSSESSVVEELKRESTADVATILISYLVMFAYISLMLGDLKGRSKFYISSKALLGFSGVSLVFLSVLGSVGFFSATGVKSTLIILEVIPFLVLAVGVDNMFILVHAMKRQPIELSLEERMGNALAEVGPSITLASMSEVLAFAVGCFTSMPACKVFSMFAALAILLDFLLQLTAFVSLIIFDFLRTEDARIDCFPCHKVPPNVATDEGIINQRPGLLTRFMREVHAPILSNWFVKILVIAIFGAFTLLSIALATRIHPGLEQEIVLPKDSYLQGYLKNVSEYLRVGPPLYFVVKNYNFSSESRQTNQLCSISQCDPNSLLNEISRASLNPQATYIAKPAASWLDDFLVWLSPEAFGCCRKFANGTFCPPDDQPPCDSRNACKDCTTCYFDSDLKNNRLSTKQFIEKLPWFLNALPSAACAKGGHGAYSASVELRGFESGVIRASSFRTFHTPLSKQVDYVNSMKAAKDFSSRMSKALKMEIFPYSLFYIYFEQYLGIWKSAAINLSIAIGAVFLVCLVFSCSLWNSSIILAVLVMIILDLFGVMAILGIQLNAISVVNLVMSVGIAVEFCVHITHAYSVSTGNRDDRVKEALGTMGASVLSGITLTKLVGVFVLRFAKTEVFVIYYFKMFLALIVFGFLHGLIFLPVLLSLVGPPTTVSKSSSHL